MAVFARNAQNHIQKQPKIVRKIEHSSALQEHTQKGVRAETAHCSSSSSISSGGGGGGVDDPAKNCGTAAARRAIRRGGREHTQGFTSDRPCLLYRHIHAGDTNIAAAAAAAAAEAAKVRRGWGWRWIRHRR